MNKVLLKFLQSSGLQNRAPALKFIGGKRLRPRPSRQLSFLNRLRLKLAASLRLVFLYYSLKVDF